MKNTEVILIGIPTEASGGFDRDKTLESPGKTSETKLILSYERFNFSHSNFRLKKH